ncbi:alpha/beta fold hydrolase [Mycolicibacterium phlei]|jgi:pimeloyl-ACP methyl ester carboxylesterase
MSTFVLVPGMCHGAWCFETLTEPLRAAGHRVLAVTPTGVAERAHLLHTGVNLDTHITDVVSVINSYAGEPVVLVGHSYGGMVITGVADRVPDHVDALVFLDAVVPHDGESCADLVNDEERRWYMQDDGSGFGVPPLAFFDARASAHPRASLLQPLRITVDLNRFRRRDFVYALDWPGESPIRPSYDRVRDDPSWVCHALDAKHNLMRDAPDDVLRILVEAAAH